MTLIDLYRLGLREEPYWYGEQTLLAWCERLARQRT